MAKITMGQTRKKSNVPEPAREGKSERSRAADAVFVVGAVTVCAMLAVPLMTAGVRDVPEEAVAVMATVGKEEVCTPSNAKTEEWSFYDYIGELFAGLLSGQ